MRIGLEIRRVLVFRRIDDIVDRVSRDQGLAVRLLVETPLQRASLLGLIQPLYDRFESFLVVWRPDAYKERNAGGSYMEYFDATFEWHSLHEHLMCHGFTMDVVEEFICKLSGLNQSEIDSRFNGKEWKSLYCEYRPPKLDPRDYPLSNKAYSYF